MLCEQVGFTWMQANAVARTPRISHTNSVSPKWPRRWLSGTAPLWRDLDRQYIVFTLALLARFATSRGDVARAGRLWGAIETEDARPVGQWEPDREEFAAAIVRRGRALRSRTLRRSSVVARRSGSICTRGKKTNPFGRLGEVSTRATTRRHWDNFFVASPPPPRRGSRRAQELAHRPRRAGPARRACRGGCGAAWAHPHRSRGGLRRRRHRSQLRLSPSSARSVSQ